MIAVIIYGPPGSGKGTQADLLAGRLGLIHLDTGKLIERTVHDSKNKNNKIIKKQRELFDSGALCDSSWVIKIIKEKVAALALSGLSVVFSGSPRTLFEAFGDKKERGLISVLEKYYNKKNIFIFNIDISGKNSIKRNSSRLMCSICGIQVLGEVLSAKKLKISECPFCGGELYRRTLDKPKIIEKRLKEYRKMTLPIKKELEGRGYKIFNINGEFLPGKVNKEIFSCLPDGKQM